MRRSNNIHAPNIYFFAILFLFWTAAYYQDPTSGTFGGGVQAAAFLSHHNKLSEFSSSDPRRHPVRARKTSLPVVRHVWRKARNVWNSTKRKEPQIQKEQQKPRKNSNEETKPAAVDNREVSTHDPPVEEIAVGILRRRDGELVGGGSLPLESASRETAVSNDGPPPRNGNSISVETSTEDQSANTSQTDSVIYSLPPVPEGVELSTLQQEFRCMLQDLSVQYSPRDIKSLQSERMRVLLEGVIASAHEYPVYRAFEVLYEDLLPLRIGGRMMYAHLNKVLRESIEKRELDINFLQQRTDLPADLIEEVRNTFVSVSVGLNGDAFLTQQQLVNSGFQEAVADALPVEYVEQFIQFFDKERIEFVDMILAMLVVSESVCEVEACDPLKVVQKIMDHIYRNPPHNPETKIDESRRRKIVRYNEMVAAFIAWEDLIPEGEGRRLDVVRGCFVGAENEKIVDALRILYVDVKPLKIAGDIIFGIVSSVMKQRQKQLASKTKQTEAKF